jgi:serine/threonine protein kinase
MKSPTFPNSESRPASLDDWANWPEAPAAKLSRAWEGGAELELDPFVAGFPEITPAEVADVIRVDLTRRWQRNDRARAESYFSRFPVVAADPELMLDVVYCEYLAREHAGEGTGLAEYEKRFPELAGALAEQVRLHEAFETLEEEGLPDGASDADTVADRWMPPANYELIEQIGSGGMGVVFKARHTGLNRLVALKMLRAVDAGNPELLMRIRAEARLVATLDHPHIVQVYDYGEHSGLPFIAMEIVSGGSLADRLDGAAWSTREAAELMVKLAAAVQFAHERRVIHRDLKPANVLIVGGAGRDLNVKITDFGLAKLCLDEATPNTRSFAFLGTPSYMAPEQAKGGSRNLGPAADIYSLGAILYEMLTGEPPIRGESPLETLGLLLSSEPISIHLRAPRVSRDLATICDKCLHREPRCRYGSAADLRADLECFLQGRPIRARRASGAERLWRWSRRNPSLAMALGSVNALLLGILCVSLWFSAQLSRELKASRSAQQAERVANQTARERLWDAYLSEAIALNNSRKVGQRFAALQAVDKAIALGKFIGDDADRTLQLRNAVLSSSVLTDLQTLRVLNEWPLDSGESDMSATAD